ncbi:unnamed protein product [Adineta ricciae]|uniref:Receptor protein-tyrosine kinase n=2 Tax=Adineta ricciae TaxID=249248 RepID=A0A814Y8T7_ADIRI|nr:unnamed protein product [Adineta ricciae]
MCVKMDYRYKTCTVILECQVQSSYPVSFNWYRYNNPLEKNRFTIDQSAFRSSIRLNNLKEAEAGFYTCEVSNGFQTLSSTGFVRVKNPVDMDNLDILDDSLPPIEFQPEIISPNDVSISKLKCELYSGQICRSVIGSQYVSLSTSNQKDIERNLIENLKYLTNNQFLSNECRQLLLPMVCSFTYPVCDNDRLNIRSICRRSCDYFQNHACANLFTYQQHSYSNLQILQNMPTCENLPPTSDDLSCIDFDQKLLNRQNGTKSSNTNSISRRPSTSISLLIVLLSILIPVGVICFLLIFMCWCCRHRNNKSHLSSCSSTSTPIKKSSHIVNTVTSSPFRSSIVPNHLKQNSRQLLPSSSSSSNTNFTNTYLRQSLLKNEVKRPLMYLSSPGNALAEIPFTNIRFLQELGEGEFGRIYKGELVDSSTKCIVKTLQTEHATPQNREEYAREIEIFRHIRHVNISCLLGICVQPQDAASVMVYERLNDGDLHEYLLQRSTTTSSSYHQRDLTDFLYISIQILSGMIYLTEKNFVHNDLSAKNILISEHMDIKISNIARYRPKYDSDYYKIANRSLPVRWMAIESLMSGIYTEMSDVWSFGVLLWEMFSYGIQPYQGRTNPEVIEMIRDRKLLTCPVNCPKRIYALMCSCWEELSEQRPTFSELMTRLRQFEEKTTTLSSTTSSSLVDVPPGISQGENIQTPKYRTFISPPPPIISSFGRGDTFSSPARILPSSTLVERENIRFEV